ncbi:hypothetical protein SGLAM104S_04955 [Streptomyces glaucescens]
MSKASKQELGALQAALAAEHAAVYGYGVVGGRIREERRAEVRAAYDAHRARRDALAREVRDLGGEPVAAAAGYALPFPVTDAESAQARRRAGGPRGRGLLRPGAGGRGTAPGHGRRRAAGGGGAGGALAGRERSLPWARRTGGCRRGVRDAHDVTHRKGTTRVWLSNRRGVW